MERTKNRWRYEHKKRGYEMKNGGKLGKIVTFWYNVYEIVNTGKMAKYL